MNAEDSLISWSVSDILKNLESSADYRNKLLTMANQYPDVATRAILCPLFSQRLLQRDKHSPALQMLLSMCKLAIVQQQRCKTETYGGGGGNRNGKCLETASDEVTFAAALTSGFLENSLLGLDAVFVPFAGVYQSHYLTVLRNRSQEAARYFAGLSTNRGSTRDSVVTRRALSLLPTKQRTQTCHYSLPFANRYCLPACTTAVYRIAQDVQQREQREMLRLLDAANPVVQVYSRDIINHKDALERKREKTTTLSPLNRTPLTLTLKRPRSPSSSMFHGSQSINESLEVTKNLTESTPHESIVNATWVKDGELVVVNGRIVHCEEGNKLASSDSTMKALTKSSSTEVQGMQKKQPSKRRERTKKSSKTHATGVQNDQYCNMPFKKRPNHRSQQGVPLKTREELISMVEALDLSPTLRETFWIGLGKAEKK